MFLLSGYLSGLTADSFVTPSRLWASMRHPHSEALLHTGALSRVRCSLAVRSNVFVVPTQFSCSSLFTVFQRGLILALEARHSVCALTTRTGISVSPLLLPCSVQVIGRESDWTSNQIMSKLRVQSAD